MGKQHEDDTDNDVDAAAVDRLHDEGTISRRGMGALESPKFLPSRDGNAALSGTPDRDPVRGRGVDLPGRYLDGWQDRGDRTGRSHRGPEDHLLHLHVVIASKMYLPIQSLDILLWAL